MSTVYFVSMTALSLVFYVPVNLLIRRAGKKAGAAGGVLLCFYNEKRVESGLGGKKA